MRNQYRIDNVFWGHFEGVLRTKVSRLRNATALTKRHSMRNPQPIVYTDRIDAAYIIKIYCHNVPV
jgi:hypothetical protein